jgi:hypothetical protein
LFWGFGFFLLFWGFGFFLLFWGFVTEIRGRRGSLAGAEDGAEGQHALLNGEDLAVQLVELLVGDRVVFVGRAPVVDLVLAELKSGAEGAELVHHAVLLAFRLRETRGTERRHTERRTHAEGEACACALCRARASAHTGRRGCRGAEKSDARRRVLVHPAVAVPDVVGRCALKTKRRRDVADGDAGRRAQAEQDRRAHQAAGRREPQCRLALKRARRCRRERRRGGVFSVLGDVVVARRARAGVGVHEGTELATRVETVGEVGREGERRVHFEEGKIACEERMYRPFWGQFCIQFLSGVEC